MLNLPTPTQALPTPLPPVGREDYLWALLYQRATDAAVANVLVSNMTTEEQLGKHRALYLHSLITIDANRRALDEAAAWRRFFSAPFRVASSFLSWMRRVSTPSPVDPLTAAMSDPQLRLHLARMFRDETATTRSAPPAGASSPLAAQSDGAAAPQQVTRLAA